MNELTQKEWDLFCEALDFADPAARRSFLDRACAGDVTLRKHVEKLLAIQPQADRFFAAAAAWMQDPCPSSPSTKT
jgi:hypothetical protein